MAEAAAVQLCIWPPSFGLGSYGPPAIHYRGRGVIFEPRPILIPEPPVPIPEPPTYGPPQTYPGNIDPQCPSPPPFPYPAPSPSTKPAPTPYRRYCNDIERYYHDVCNTASGGSSYGACEPGDSFLTLVIKTQLWCTCARLRWVAMFYCHYGPFYPGDSHIPPIAGAAAGCEDCLDLLEGYTGQPRPPMNPPLFPGLPPEPPYVGGPFPGYPPPEFPPQVPVVPSPTPPCGGLMNPPCWTTV